jgi:F-type H+-transporting ATPase subunit b
VRNRTWLAGAGIVALALFGVAGPAYAQEGEEEHDFADHDAEECFDILAEGGTVDDCQEAPSPLAPEPNEIIWGSAAFAVLLVAMWKWGVPAVRNMMEMREERIRTDLERAESARLEGEAALEQYRAQIGDARAEAARIIDEGRQSADEVRRELIARAEADAAEIRERAQQDVALATERAMAELRSRVGQLSIDLAEKIVERNLDRDTQMALVESYIAQVGNN